MSVPRDIDGNGKVGVLERLTRILQSLTFQNIIVFAILVVLAVPSYAVWQLLHDSELRREIMSYAKELDLGVPCQIITYSFSGQSEKTAVISGVEVLNQFEVVVGTKVPGQITATDAAAACKTMLEMGAQVRAMLADQRTREKK
jgi:heme/copper-type cytochrome/quinol oxidase subunit 2